MASRLFPITLPALALAIALAGGCAKPAPHARHRPDFPPPPPTSLAEWEQPASPVESSLREQELRANYEARLAALEAKLASGSGAKDQAKLECPPSKAKPKIKAKKARAKIVVRKAADCPPPVQVSPPRAQPPQAASVATVPAPPPSPPTPAQPAPALASLPPGAQQRVGDLTTLKAALANYRIKHGSYPVSPQWSGVASLWGPSGPAWIPGLAPEFIPSLPRDPRNHENPEEQYIYRSDGKDYKLIAHHPGDCEAIQARLPAMRDPLRKCGAYGFWTPGAAGW